MHLSRFCRHGIFSLLLPAVGFAGTLLSSQASAQCFTPRNAAEVELALEKLKVAGSVLFVAAHPDDENSALLAYFANEQLFRTGYLALNRGEGGQNLIGSEKGVPLGIIRTAELLAARKVDGAEQWFTRAYDFGYSKSVEETFEHWDREKILGDVVWAIRKFQPDIIVDRFPVTGEGKHGHHTASGVLAEEAFTAAADPERFKDQLAFVSPWQAKTLYLNNVPAKWDPKFTPEGKISLDIGGFNRLLGKSYGEIAAESRNNHKSQGFGTAAEAGPRLEYFTWRMGEKALDNPFERKRFLISKLPNTVPLKQKIDDAIRLAHDGAPAASLVRVLMEIRSLLPVLGKRWEALKAAEVDRLLLDVSGARLEALAGASSVVPGAKLPVELRALIRREAGLYLHASGLSIPGASHENPSPEKVPADWVTFKLETTIPKSAPFSNQYWLNRPIRAGQFDIADQQSVGLPFSPPAVSASFTFLPFGAPVGGVKEEAQKIAWTCPVTKKTLDQQDGDRYEELTIVPAATMDFALGSLFVPAGRSSTVQLSASSTMEGMSGSIVLEAPEGWKVEPHDFPVTFSERDTPLELAAIVTPGADAKNGSLHAIFTGANGERSSSARIRVIHRHIEPHSYLQPAEVSLSTADLQAPKLRIGSITGAGDDIVPVLQSLGYTAEVLSDEVLLHDDLGRFETIVIGVRALNTRKNWPAFHPRLMEFVERGGTLVMQYSSNDWLNKVPARFGPYPFELTSDRITNENAPVKFLTPEHPILHVPNEITAQDFEGWVQERGLWLAGGLDSHYTPILEMNDPGEPMKNGALIVADFGKGKFIYTGLSFFRQLPAGNAGAIRLFVNLLSYGH